MQARAKNPMNESDQLMPQAANRLGTASGRPTPNLRDRGERQQGLHQALSTVAYRDRSTELAAKTDAA